MKNIYILPTDKPSRYVTNYMEQNMQWQHIYITSDEEIKEGDWCLDETFKPVNLWFYPEKLKGKIILTTNQDLIKDGVQAIDDEFLEWFVKNPSCEEVEIQDWYSIYLSCCRSKEECYCNRKKIIIPKEEPKQIKCYCGHTTYCDCSPLEEPKQETLEEVAESRFGTDMDSIRGSVVYDLNTDLKRGFIEGAKWQQERMYSEEEVFNIIDKIFHMYASSYRQDAKEWFEQFKKK